MANPTLATLRTNVARDLRDPSMKTFQSAYITDLINSGIEEVSRVYPQEVIEEVTAAPGTTAYDTDCTTVFRVEVNRPSVTTGNIVLAENTYETADRGAGWEHFAGQIRLSYSQGAALLAGDEIIVWGYAPRPQLTSDAQVSVLDDAAEWGVRRYARAAAFQLMHNDRALFKQWQGGSQNTDVSPNQLNQMVSLYASEWDRTRNYLRRLRRN